MIQRRKLICLMLVCIALLSGSVGAWAEGVVEGSEPYVWGDFTYCLDADGGACILEYTGSDSNLSIPQEMDGHPVRSIGDWAFAACKSLTEVELPEGLTAVGRGAFAGCEFLERFIVSAEHACFAAVDGVLYEKAAKTLVAYPCGRQDAAFAVPEGVSAIGELAFHHCESLTEILLPAGLAVIGEEAFFFCGSLAEIQLPESLTSIGKCAFFFCNSLTEIELPESLTTIGDSAFAYCKSIERFIVSAEHACFAEIDGVLYEKATKTLLAYPRGRQDAAFAVPEGVSAIGEEAFSYCASLTEIKLPESLMTIGDYAFYDCDSLTMVELPQRLIAIEEGAFAGCESLTEIQLPESLTTIGDYVFSGCLSLTMAELPEGLTAIGEWAFWYCESLTEIELPEGLTTIGEGAFSDCESLTEIKLPESLTTIGDGAFDSCKSLTVVVEKGSYAQQWAKESGIPYTYPDSMDWLQG